MYYNHGRSQLTSYSFARGQNVPKRHIWAWKSYGNIKPSSKAGATSTGVFSALRLAPRSETTANLDLLRVFRGRREDPDSSSTPSTTGEEGKTETPPTRGRASRWLTLPSLIIMRNRSSSKRMRSPAVDIPPVPALPSDLEQSEVAESVEEPAPETPAFLELSDDAILEKFNRLNRLETERIQRGATKNNQTNQWTRPKFDRTLDRYNNVYPWIDNRVRLQVPDGYNDYINASPITPTPSEDKEDGKQDEFICMQGPKEQTIDHTWHMIWHSLSQGSNSSPAVIIMLTPTHVEHPLSASTLVEKCYPYYPLTAADEPLIINGTSQLGEDFKATISFVEMEETSQGTAIELRKLNMKVEGQEEEKTIYHFLYSDWPDFGALEDENIESILALMVISREKNIVPENPRIVHCSAGVGRSGTFVALEYLMGEMQSGAWDKWDEEDGDPIFDTVDRLRMQRRTMVQADGQYLCLYRALRKLWHQRLNPTPVGGEEFEEIEPPEEIEEMIDEMQQPPAKQQKLDDDDVEGSSCATA